jgi:hypothetical protein
MGKTALPLFVRHPYQSALGADEAIATNNGARSIFPLAAHCNPCLDVGRKRPLA